MQQLIEFISQHWMLALAFIAILGVLIGLELRDRVSGLQAISPQEAIMLINRQDAVVLDIRSPEVFSKGHIGNAVNIPFEQLDNKLAALAKHKDKPLIIIYANGQPAAKIKPALKNSGFNQIVYLKGGIANWQSAGLPLVKG